MPEAQIATVSFSLGDTGAEGTAPAAITVNKGEAATIPANGTAYVAGKTLTGWTDGENTYAAGDKVTLNSDITLTAVFTENTATKISGAVVFNFRRDQGAPIFAIEGKSGMFVAQATVGGAKVDVKLDIDATAGKFNNASNDNWTQTNDGTKFVVPMVSGCTVTFDGYNADGTLTIGEASFKKGETYTYSGADGDVTITAAGVGYLRHITVTYPAN